MIQFHEMSEGWTVDYWPTGELVSITRPNEIGGGIVTICFAKRVFAGGYGHPHHPASTKQYKGRGWMDQIVRDAVDWLEEVMK